MHHARFDIQFTGDLIPGTDPATARERIQGLFGLSDAAVDWLFSGETVTIERGADSGTVAYIRERFRDAGALVRVLAVRDRGGVPTWAPVTGGRDGAHEVPRLFGSSRPDWL